MLLWITWRSKRCFMYLKVPSSSGMFLDIHFYMSHEGGCISMVVWRIVHDNGNGSKRTICAMFENVGTWKRPMHVHIYMLTPTC